MVSINAAVISVGTLFYPKGQVIIIHPRKIQENRQKS